MLLNIRDSQEQLKKIPGAFQEHSANYTQTATCFTNHT